MNDKETIELLFAHADNLMIQEFLDGQEIGADVYIDMLSGEVVSIFTKGKSLCGQEKQIKRFLLKMKSYFV